MSTANLTAKQRMEGKRAIMARILGMKDVGIKHYSFGMILNVFRAYYSLGEVSRLARAHERERGFLYTHVISARPDVAVLSPVRFRPMATRGLIIVPNFAHNVRAERSSTVNP